MKIITFTDWIDQVDQCLICLGDALRDNGAKGKENWGNRKMTDSCLYVRRTDLFYLGLRNVLFEAAGAALISEDGFLWGLLYHRHKVPLCVCQLTDCVQCLTHRIWSWQHAGSSITDLKTVADFSAIHNFARGSNFFRFAQRGSSSSQWSLILGFLCKCMRTWGFRIYWDNEEKLVEMKYIK